MRGADRNKPCPCGSGAKAKHCRALHIEDIEAAYRENEERELVRRIAAMPRRRDRLSTLAIASIVAGGLVP